MKNKKICSFCILDETVPEIFFDKEGKCNYCKINDEIMNQYPAGLVGEKKLNSLIEEIKRSGKNKTGCIGSYSIA